MKRWPPVRILPQQKQAVSGHGRQCPPLGLGGAMHVEASAAAVHGGSAWHQGLSGCSYSGKYHRKSEQGEGSGECATW